MSAILIRSITTKSNLFLTSCRYLAATQQPEGKASLDQLVKLEATLQRHLPSFFSSPHPFVLYSNDMTFIDNIRNVKVYGISQYIFQVALIKIYYNIRYNHRRVELLNLVKNPEDSCIKIRWRIITRPGMMKFILNLFKYHTMEVWKDGISTLHVDKDGKIYRHVCDNIDVETSDIKTETKGSAIKNTLINKGLSV